MTLNPGTRLGPYEILSGLGAGGMGEVYRALDTNLKRQIAIKVLPAAVAADSARLARFQREAEVLAALSHPNIAHIHGLERSDGTIALVMELVEGATLADRVASGPIPLDEALAIAKQIAEALEAAHGQGIIHRDLKPSNIKVRKDGAVKVLDFGLAKAMDLPGAGGSGLGAGASLSQSPTITTPAMTQAGMILGTAAYMSPEQARGRSVDKRADVWAFGCVLYELLTGRRAFEADDVSSTLALVITTEPDWHALPSNTPVAVRRLLRRCLAKDPEKRLHDIADARLELDDAFVEPVGAAASRPASRRIGWGVALVATAIGGAAIVWFAAPRARPPLADGPSPDAKLERLTNDSGLTRMPTLSPDGRLLAYASDRAGNGDLDIWVQQTAGGTPLRLTDDPADDSMPDFSPDGSQLVFRSERNGGGVYVVPALGGPARLIAQEGRRPRFSPDGSRVAYWAGPFRGDIGSIQHGRGVYVVALSGGTPQRVLPDFDATSDPVWAPDGRSALIACRRERTGPQDWCLAPLDGSAPQKTDILETPRFRGASIVPDRWTSSGVVFSFDQDLWRVPLAGNGHMAAAPRRLTLGVGPYIDPTAGPNGELVFARLVTQRAVERASLTNPTEPVMRLYADSGRETMRASGTTDGSVIVFERAAAAAREIWIKNIHTGHQETVVRVQAHAQVDPTVSSDGARIAYTQNSNAPGTGVAGIGYVVEASGGVPRKVCDACSLYGFLADNQHVLVALDDGHAIRVVDTRTGDGRDIVVAEDGSRLDRPHASPDDRWLAFRRSRGSAGKTIVVRLTTARALRSDSLEPVDEPTTSGRPCGWSLDSRVVYLLLDTDGFRCVWGQRVDPETGALVGKPFAVRHFHATTGMSTSLGNAVTAGGFVYEAADMTANLWKLTLPEPR